MQQNVAKFQAVAFERDPFGTMAEDEEIAALVIDNGSGMCKGAFKKLVRRNESNADLF